MINLKIKKKKSAMEISCLKKKFSPIHSNVMNLNRMSLCQGINWVVNKSETDQ